MAARFEEVTIGRVRPNEANIRQDLGDMEALTTEVKTIGIKQPLIVYPHPTLDGDFLVQDGHRRLNAAQNCGALFVPCLIVDAPKRGRREDIEVMLSTGRLSKVLNQLEVSAGFEQLVAEGMDETTIGKKYKLPKSEVKARARISSAPENLKTSFASGHIDLVDMKRIQELEDAGVPEVFEEVVNAVAHEASRGWAFNVENIIATKQHRHERTLLVEELVDAGAKEAAGYAVTYDGQHDEVTETMTVAEHVAAKHVFYLQGTDVSWFAKRSKAKPEPTVEEVQAAQEIRSLDAGLAIQARVRRKFLVDQVFAKDGGAGAAADFDLLFMTLWDDIKRGDDELLSALSGIAIPEDPQEPDDIDGYDEETVHDAWVARVEKAFRKMSWQQLSRAAVVVRNQTCDKSLAKTSGFDRDAYGWLGNRDYYATIQEKLGYRLDPSERNAVLWAEIKGGVARYYPNETVEDGANRLAKEDLVILDD